MKYTKRLALGIVLVVLSLFAVESKEAEASGFYCPSWYECARIDEVVSGKANCPEGYECHPVLGMPDCPTAHVCFIKTKKSSSQTQDTSATSTFSIFISAIEPFSIYPGYEVSIKGQNLKASLDIMVLNGPTLMTSLKQNSIKNDSAGSQTIKFTLPNYFTPGPYSLYLESSDGTKSNTVPFYVTSVVPVTLPQNGTNATTTFTPVPTVPINNTTNINIKTNNYPTPVNNYNPNATNNSNISGRFAIGSSVRTTDNLRVRSSASINGIILTTQPLGSRGIVKGGPIVSGGYTWWNIDYASGLDGWSVENYLTENYSAAYAPTPAPVTTSNPDQCYTFSTDLSYGSSLPNELMYLQTAFMAEGFFIAELEKRPNPYFGDSTLAAAISYQKKYNITPQAGFVGPKTRAQLNMKYGCR